MTGLNRRRLLFAVCLTAVFTAGLGVPARAETGAELWLRYRLTEAPLLASYRQTVTSIVAPGTSPTAGVIRAELRRGLTSMLGVPVPEAAAVQADGAVVVGTPASPLIAGLGWQARLQALGADGYIVRTAVVGGRRAVVIASQGEIGALYGTFAFLRLMQTRQPIAAVDLEERPRLELRLLNHWDNLNATVERGYAGASIWAWNVTGTAIDPRIQDYARANASVGVNGAVINNVNANPAIFTPPYLERARAIANVLRPYGIRVYLSANFAAPRMIGKLATADPTDPSVARWWRETVDQIYKYIPDFGGFVVKANSEGQPGPQDYKRTHADGANLLADALKPHGGIVMWRAFVYNAEVDPDRIKRAYLEFVPLDGTFRDNVFVQVKNGPLDFMPREPFHPMFGAMPKTPLMAELQITQEYLGHSNHLVYLATMWKEFLDADTFAKGAGSPVSRIVDGSIEGHRRSGMAGVANTGQDQNWTGHHFGQANWYAYGRLAWNPDLGAEEIADEWTKMTWSTSPRVVATIRSMLMESREAFVNYTMPVGLHHLIGGNHYAVMPENNDPRRADWSATYYHHAGPDGIGFDRTRTGSDAVRQYRPEISAQWADSARVPENLLLWFHHLPWDFRMKSGRTLWDELVFHYTAGAEQARQLQARWEQLDGQVDPERFQAVQAKLKIQVADAAAWRDKCLRYFQQFSKRPLPAFAQ